MNELVVWWETSVSVPMYYHPQPVGGVDGQRRFGRKCAWRKWTHLLYLSLSDHHLPEPRIAGSVGVCVYVCVCECVHFCVNVWCLHLMFAQLINSGDAVLRWHIVQASLSPHPNQINSEYHLCTQRPPGQDLELWDAASRAPRRKKQEHCLKIASLSGAFLSE